MTITVDFFIIIYLAIVNIEKRNGIDNFVNSKNETYEKLIFQWKMGKGVVASKRIQTNANELIIYS